MIGLETSLGLMLTHMVHTGVIDYAKLVDVMAVAPRAILRQERVAIEPGCMADLTVFDPNEEWTVRAEDFLSKAKNSGFVGHSLKGRATHVLVGGKLTLRDGVIVD